MTVHVGKWRFRVSCRRRQYSALFCDRTRFEEGTVYRFSLGLVIVTALVDCMTERQRTLCRQRAEQALAEFEWLK